MWELDYGQIFKDFPIEVSPHLSIDDLELSGAEKEKFEKAVKEKVLQMMEAIKEESGYTWNLVAIICCAQGKKNFMMAKATGIITFYRENRLKPVMEAMIGSFLKLMKGFLVMMAE